MFFSFLSGSCDWDSPCDKGVCYYNSTGCPVVGYHRVNTSINKGGSPTHDPVEDFSTQYGPDRMSVLMLCLVLLMAVVTVAVCHCSTTLKEWYIHMYKLNTCVSPLYCTVYNIHSYSSPSIERPLPQKTASSYRPLLPCTNVLTVHTIKPPLEDHLFSENKLRWI